MTEWLADIQFAHPFAAALLFLVSFAAWYGLRKQTHTLSYASALPLKGLPKTPALVLRGPVLFLLQSLAVCSMIIAAARPQQLSALPGVSLGRNLMLALDISISMRAQDFGGDYGRVNRLDAVKAVIKDFVREREQDRIGLVVFGGRAHLQAPLTQDRLLIEALVDSLEPGMAGNGTAIGDGLGLALKRVREVDADSRAVILLTDGVSNSGHVDPLKAAEVARDLGIKVHTVGIGSNEEIRTLQGGGFWGPRVSSRVEFDEETLKTIARETGGVYFHASDVHGLKRVYEEINTLEKTEQEEEQQQQVNELYYPFLLAALGFLCLSFTLESTLFRKIP